MDILKISGRVSQKIETDKVILTIHENNFAGYLIKQDVILDEKAVRETKRILEEFRPGAKYFVLAEGEGFFRVSRKARRLGASRSFSSHLAAVAFYSTNFSLHLLSELYNKIDKPAVVTRAFRDRELAMDWLGSLMLKHETPGQ